MGKEEMSLPHKTSVQNKIPVVDLAIYLHLRDLLITTVLYNFLVSSACVPDTFNVVLCSTFIVLTFYYYYFFVSRKLSEQTSLPFCSCHPVTISIVFWALLVIYGMTDTLVKPRLHNITCCQTGCQTD